MRDETAPLEDLIHADLPEGISVRPVVDGTHANTYALALREYTSEICERTSGVPCAV